MIFREFVGKEPWLQAFAGFSLIRWALFGLLLASGSVLSDDTPLQRIKVANAEDLALSQDGQWVVASSLADGFNQAGTLYSIHVETGATRELHPFSIATEISGTCEAPPRRETFSPHGIAIQKLAPGQETLFVVNHGGRESIELFKVSSGESLELTWAGCIELPEGTMGNAVAVTPDFRLYVTNMRSFKPGSEGRDRWMGNILVWTDESGWDTVSGSEIYAPNGLLVADDASEIYVASWAAGEVIKLTLESANGNKVERRASLSLPFLPDNLRWRDQASFLATGSHGTVENLVACVTGNESCDRSLPTGIASIDAREFQLQCMRDVPFPLGTSTIAVKDTLWLGPIAGEHIWVIDNGNDAAACH